MRKFIKATGAAILFIAMPLTQAELCETSLTVNDRAGGFYKGDKKLKKLEVSSNCPIYTIHLKHDGSDDKSRGGRNIVISKERDKSMICYNADKFASQGYVDPSDRNVVAKSQMIGGGENTYVSFSPKNFAGEKLVGFSTFPGLCRFMSFEIKIK